MAIASLLRNFPQWTDAAIASLLNATEEMVAQVRQEITEGASGEGIEAKN